MAKLSWHPEVVHTELEDGAILLHLGTRFYYSLNETGRTIWALLESSAGPDDLSRRLVERYPVTEDHAHAALSRFLAELEREQLVAVGAADGPSAPASPDHARPMSGHAARTAVNFSEPKLTKHAEPLHEVVMNPFDPQLPLAE
jgi:Coenzyme PQQ synthesis protein D (PqqD)